MTAAGLAEDNRPKRIQVDPVVPKAKGLPPKP